VLEFLFGLRVLRFKPGPNHRMCPGNPVRSSALGLESLYPRFYYIAFCVRKVHNSRQQEIYMAKKWTDFTKREKVIGVLVFVFAAVSISGISSAINSGIPAQTQAPAVQVAAPITTYKEVKETEIVTFSKETRNDSLLPSGTSKITTVGVDGIKTKTYKLTLVDGVETTKTLIDEVVTIAPVNEVTSVGTYVAPIKKVTSSDCDANYSGVCVPIASDVDCAGGIGDGPAYVTGPVKVIGKDVYALDRDRNGVGCES